LIVAEPRGFCAGVERAVQAVNRELDVWGPPVYVRRHVVHNAHVVAELEARGAVFVESVVDVPVGARVVFAAHGVSPSVVGAATRRRHQVVDATCPLVNKVHAEVRRYASAGYRIVLIGHAGHDEVIGTMGQAPESIVLVETPAQAEALELDGCDKLAYATQTTLSVDETAEIIAVLRARFPDIVGPQKDDICYATTNRQIAVKRLAIDADAVVVVGSRESSNSKRLVETAQACGVPAWLVDDERELDPAALDRFETIGVTAGASTPDSIFDAVCLWFRDRGVQDVVTLAPVVREDVVFKLPHVVASSARRGVGSPGSDDAAGSPVRT
jgi:4-hydroxy-3-methylbut-2-enyl diphosphate reductase